MTFFFKNPAKVFSNEIISRVIENAEAINLNFGKLTKHYLQNFRMNLECDLNGFTCSTLQIMKINKFQSKVRLDKNFKRKRTK